MFSKDRINTSRQKELDLAKALAVIFMVMIHSQTYFANSDVIDSYFGGFNDFVGMVPAAPMFMFLLGIGIVYTRDSSPKTFIKRGGYLFLLGYLLNFLRGFLPNIIKAYLSSDIYYVYSGFSEFFNVDILQFSGLVFIAFGIFKYLKFSKPHLILLSVLLPLLNVGLLNFNVDGLIPSGLTGLIWGNNEISYFPFLTWIFYPLIGYIFGDFLIRCKDKQKFYLFFLIISLTTLIISLYYFNYYLEIPSALVTDVRYYHHTLTDNIVFTSMIILEISILSFLTKFIPESLQKIINRWSKNTTNIFFIHWIIITWLAILIPSGSLSMVPFILLLISITILSDFLSIKFSQFKERRKEKSIGGN